MTEQLKRCPFCGGEAYIEQPGTRRQSCIVECGSCGLRHDSGDEGDRCGTSWNRRALESRVLEEKKDIDQSEDWVNPAPMFAPGHPLFAHPTPDDAKRVVTNTMLTAAVGAFMKCEGTFTESIRAAIDAAMQADKEPK